MDLNIEILYQNKKKIITKYTFESNKRFNERLLFIKKLENDDIEWKEAVKLSKIWYNIIYNKCKYNRVLYSLIIKYHTN